MNDQLGVKFHPKVSKEYLDAVDWYNEKQIGLGNTFFEVVLTKMKEISTNPLSFPLKNKIYREAVIQKFPFVVIFRVNFVDREVEILAVFHTSRNPRKKKR